jgi:hypothetical protein
MWGSRDFHSTLTVSPGRRIWPATGEISLAEYAPVCALEVLTNCGAQLNATATMIKTNRRIVIFCPPLDQKIPSLSENLSIDFTLTFLLSVLSGTNVPCASFVRVAQLRMTNLYSSFCDSCHHARARPCIVLYAGNHSYGPQRTILEAKPRVAPHKSKLRFRILEFRDADLQPGGPQVSLLK